MKRLTIIFLSCLLLLALSLPALAADNSRSYSFELTCNGSNYATVQVGDVLTVEFTLRTNASYPLYAMQNEILYDTNYFKLVSGSFSTSDGYTASFWDMKAGDDDKVLMSFVSAAEAGEIQAASVLVGSFKLQAIAAGNSTVRNSDNYCTTADGWDKYASDPSNLSITIKDAGSNPNQPGGNGGKGSGGTPIVPSLVGTTPRFSDVPAGFWAFDHIQYLAERGYVTGNNGLFYPGNPITRAEFITILARMSQEALPAYSGQFSDVSTGAYYAQAVAWGVAAGITNGVGPTAFAPDQLISREQMAAMLYRYAAYKSFTLPAPQAAAGFTDQAAVSAYALSAVQAMQQAGIINGYTDNTYRPDANASRAEAAKMLALLDQLQ